jgi:hypothetical protein
MRDVDKHGIGRVVQMALEAVDPHGNCPLHLSLDIDAVDPHFAPGTGTMVRGGLTYREIHYICEEMALTGRLVGMDLVEVRALAAARSAPVVALGRWHRRLSRARRGPPLASNVAARLTAPTALCSSCEQVNPHLEPGHTPTGRVMHNEDPDVTHVSPTVNLGVELVLSALGKTIMHDHLAR